MEEPLSPSIAFGPVRSRRFGWSLGVNNVPYKHCTYSCRYCQVGNTHRTEAVRRAFFAIDEIVEDVARKLDSCGADGIDLDYVTFVPDGEPTLDANLGAEIRALRELGKPVAVLTNGSLLPRADVRREVAAADLVSIKIDTVNPITWCRLNAPHRLLGLESILEGVTEFSREYAGCLVTETMLVAGINDDAAAIREIASFLAGISPERAYVAVPVRPPADQRAVPPADEVVARAFEIIREFVPGATLLASPSGGARGRRGSGPADLLALVAVHPIREETLDVYVEETGMKREVVVSMLRSGLLEKTSFGNEVFVRRGRAAAATPDSIRGDASDSSWR